MPVLPERFVLHVNGEHASIEAESNAPLLYILRNDLSLNGPKFGCGLGQCGACTVLVDGQPVRSCIVPVSAAAGRSITTLEGLGTYADPHPIQQAFISEQAAQCGYCMNGMILAAKALLDRNPNPTEDDVRHALDGHLCRCGSHLRVIRTVQRAAREMAGPRDSTGLTGSTGTAGARSRAEAATLSRPTTAGTASTHRLPVTEVSDR